MILVSGVFYDHKGQVQKYLLLYISEVILDVVIRKVFLIIQTALYGYINSYGVCLCFIFFKSFSQYMLLLFTGGLYRYWSSFLDIVYKSRTNFFFLSYF